MINIAWITSRKNPCWDWFIQSLDRQLGGSFSGIRIIAVDYWLQAVPHAGWSADDVKMRFENWSKLIPSGLETILTPCKPTPWQGPHRLTKHDYFAAANARNTAICHAKDGYLVFCDDLSVLMPGWLQAVRAHAQAGRIVCGSFRKVCDLVVEDGLPRNFKPHVVEGKAAGIDSRMADLRYGGLDHPCPPNWLFGCSFGAPVKRFLEINGLPEMCDSTGIGMEDCHTGIAFANNGHKLYYDRSMMTYESEERHHVPGGMLRLDKKKDGVVIVAGYGEHPNEKGHHLVRHLAKAKRFKNYFEEGGIAALRQRVLAGEPFPNIVLPDTDWFDKQSLREL